MVLGSVRQLMTLSKDSNLVHKLTEQELAFFEQTWQAKKDRNLPRVCHSCVGGVMGTVLYSSMQASVVCFRMRTSVESLLLPTGEAAHDGEYLADMEDHDTAWRDSRVRGVRLCPVPISVLGYRMHVLCVYVCVPQLFLQLAKIRRRAWPTRLPM